MKIAVGLSGGIDSTAAALLLRAAGHDIVGVTMALGRSGEDAMIAETQRVADQLKIPLSVIDLSSAWQNHVTDYIRTSYLGGLTPNPCVRCNEVVKFGLLPTQALSVTGADRFATGHYARLEMSASGPRLLRAIDRTKDQSYFLYRVSPTVLARTLFPLGGLTKREVRAYVEREGFDFSSRSESQDFCGGDVQNWIGRDDQPGNIVTTDGRVLGHHRGFWHYTVGMRKGLGIGGGTPYYVVRLNAARNEVVVAFRESAVVRSFDLCEMVWFSSPLNEALSVKVRSAGEPRPGASVNGSRVTLSEGLTGIAPGQSAVFFRGDEVVGGGIIRKTEVR